MQVILNGKKEEIHPDGLNVQELLHQKNIHPQTVAVEVNLKIIERTDYPTQRIMPEDTIEIVRCVGGG